MKMKLHLNSTHRPLHAGAGAALALAALTAAPALQGANILLNPGFEDSGGAWPPVAPTSWTYYGPGENFYIESNPNAHSGGRFYKIWGSIWTGGAPNWTGIYQDAGSAPGWTYQANGWFFTLSTDAMGADNRAWLEVSFRDAGNNLLALYKTVEFGSSWGVDTWFHLFVTNACDISNNNVVTGAVTQLIAPAGTAWVRCQLVHYQINNNGGSVYFDDAVLDQVSGALPPVLSNVSPGNKLFAPANAGFSFTVTSPSGTAIPDSGIGVTLNGSNVSAGLSISGTPSARNVSYLALVTNLNYRVSVTVTDAVGLTVSGAYEFDTFSPVFLWESEDFDFDAGAFINNPVLSGTPGNPNSYFGKVGVEGVDEYETSGEGDHFYRGASDRMATTYSGDLPRQKFLDAGVADYKLGWFNSGEWVNFTRVFPAGTFNLYARLAGGMGTATAKLSRVDPGPTVTDLGTFSFTGRGWNTFDYVPLLDGNGNLVALTLGGQQTLRFTTGGGADPNFLMLVPAATDLPTLSGIYPTGTRPFEHTNKFSFNVSSASTPIPESGIKLLLDGHDVTATLQISGTPLARSVVCPVLLPNAIHSAVILVTNANGVGISRSNRFDTFNPANPMTEAEDYDYEGGQFIDDPLPGFAPPYGYLVAAGVPDVDFHHTTVEGEQHWYRAAPNVPTEVAGDYLRQKFVDYGVSDYNLGWFGNGDWANYTRAYPAGNYFVYGRLAGSGGYSMYLDKVVSGAGTTSQVTQRLGRWGATGRGWQTYDWVPLTDEGLAAPVIVNLGGQATLRILTTGNCNPNYFMLVPTTGITVSIARAGADVVLSFPTQNGVNYRVFAKGNLATDNWALVANVAGNGGVQTLTQPATGSPRFYRVVAP